MNDYLLHFGVKGMKWGVRKAPDRPIGIRRKRRGIISEFVNLRRKKTSRPTRPKSKPVQDLSKKPIKKMTDAELSKRIDRLSQEKRLRDLQNATSPVSKGHSIIKEVLTNSLKTTAQNVITQQATKRVNALVDKQFGDPTKTHDDALKRASAREKEAKAEALEFKNEVTRNNYYDEQIRKKRAAKVSGRHVRW